MDLTACAAPDQPADPARLLDLPIPRQHLEQLQPPAPTLDTATVTTGLGDVAARESVARLLTRARTRPLT